MGNLFLATFVIIIFIPVAIYFLNRFKPNEKSILLKILFMGLVIRVGVIFLFSTFVPKVETLSPDAYRYVDSGKNIAANWAGNQDLSHSTKNNISNQHSGYYYVTAVLYLIVGPITYAPAYLNALLGIFSILLMINLLANWFAWKVIRTFALTISFMPSIIMWNSFPLKDTLVFFLVIIIFYNYLMFLKNRTFTSMFLIIAPIYPLYHTRFYLVFVILGTIFASLILFAGELSLKRILRGFAISFFVFVGLFSIGIGNELLNRWEKEANVKQLNRYKDGLTINNRTVHEGDTYNTPLDILKYLPARLITFLFAPFPWQIVNARMAVSFVEMPFWWYMFYFVIKGILFMIKHKHVREFLPLVLYSLLLTVLYSIITGNLGDAYRMRAQVLPIYFMMGSVGLAVKTAKQLKVDTNFILSKNLRVK
jgi:hypothetical protein